MMSSSARFLERKVFQFNLYILLLFATPFDISRRSNASLLICDYEQKTEVDHFERKIPSRPASCEPARTSAKTNDLLYKLWNLCVNWLQHFCVQRKLFSRVYHCILFWLIYREVNGKVKHEPNPSRKERPQKRGGGGGRYEPYGNVHKRYRVFVSNIPYDVKWQALKDLMKEKGKVHNRRHYTSIASGHFGWPLQFWTAFGN